MKEAVEELAVLSEEKNQKLTTYLPPEVMIRADAAILKQAVSNVLHNAICHTQEKGKIEEEMRHLFSALTG